MRVPSPVDALLMACLHRVAHHDFEQPFWIEDIHLLASRFDRGVAGLRCARARSIRALCLQGLRAAGELFQTAVPLDVLTRSTDRRSIG